jgi:hypothetical protein
MAGSSSVRAAAPIVRARAPFAPASRRSSIVVRAEEGGKAELSGTEKVINSITSFLNNSPLAQGKDWRGRRGASKTRLTVLF